MSTSVIPCAWQKQMIFRGRIVCFFQKHSAKRKIQAGRICDRLNNILKLSFLVLMKLLTSAWSTSFFLVLLTVNTQVQLCHTLNLWGVWYGIQFFTSHLRYRNHTSFDNTNLRLTSLPLNRSDIFYSCCVSIVCFADAVVKTFFNYFGSFFSKKKLLVNFPVKRIVICNIYPEWETLICFCMM